MVKRVYCEKKHGFAHEADKLRQEMKNVLRLPVVDVRVFIRYDVEGLDDLDFGQACAKVFSEPAQDKLYLERLPELNGYQTLVIEYLPGQYDQRADSAAQCIQLLTQKERPAVACAKVIAVRGVNFSELQIAKAYLVNPLESREGTFDLPDTLIQEFEKPLRPKMHDGFYNFTDAELERFWKDGRFAMSFEDIKCVREYFARENRNPYETELKVLDTYWSDHCRHTTFLTQLDDISINSDNPHIKDALELYQKTAGLVHGETFGTEGGKYPCLMDMATLAAKRLKAEGKLDNLDESDEVNACSVEVEVDVDGKPQRWLVMFKNETHNHPTEIEPFGGAATCLGGAIRDPLSGRAYVYQAMRVTGGGDPTEPLSKTLSGKLPQRVITTQAAHGFSSYGNQIGLATGLVTEIFDEKYKAKRLECGYVIGAVPKDNVVRKQPQDGDVIVLLGGETGRDGCGGATGSSKSHTLDSVGECGAEVQKGNPVTERKIQRLFRRPEVAKLIIKCNDFGAGGVSVAVGELADSIDIHLDRVPKKYAGLTATELAISESQERMAVVIEPQNLQEFIDYAAKENLTATEIAKVTDSGRLRMYINYKVCVDIARDFLNTNGAKQHTKVTINETVSGYMERPHKDIAQYIEAEDYKRALGYELSRLNVCSQKGLAEMFDSTIGAGTVIMPFGGKYGITPSESMVAKLPVGGETDTVTVSTFGYNPALMSEAPFTGAVYSVVMSVARAVAAGADYKSVRLSLQEYFKKLGQDPKRWGEPAAAMLGAFYAQMKLGVPAIGGKDSMSGSFESLDVPPTLISFAMGMGKASTTVSNTFTTAGAKVYRVRMPRDEFGLPDFRRVPEFYQTVAKQIANGTITAAAVIGEGGAVSACAKSCLGNGLGFTLTHIEEDHFLPALGDMLLEVAENHNIVGLSAQFFGKTTADGKFTFSYKNDLGHEELVESFTWRLKGVFPVSSPAAGDVTAENVDSPKESCKVFRASFLSGTARPHVVIPVFPGTNCEDDTARQFYAAGAEVETVVFRNRNPREISESIAALAESLSWSQILALPGGFSGGDEPDGSGKFIVAALCNKRMKDAIHDLIERRDGLILGICNGFQALVKTGLLPYGRITEQTAASPTLTFNNIGRHVSTISRIRVASNNSPWLSHLNVGDVYNVAVSHGEGRFVAAEEDLQALIENGQIATQYADYDGNATMVSPMNPNGSIMAVEGLLAAAGRIFGKMGHSERVGKNLYKNIPGEFDMQIFKGGVGYFK